MKKILLAAMLLIGTGTSLSADNLEELTKACDGGDALGCKNYAIANKQ